MSETKQQKNTPKELKESIELLAGLFVTLIDEEEAQKRHQVAPVDPHKTELMKVINHKPKA